MITTYGVQELETMVPEKIYQKEIPESRQQSVVATVGTEPLDSFPIQKPTV